MAYLLGTLVGGFLMATLIGLLVGLAFKSQEPTKRAVCAASIGWALCGIIAGFGMADGGPFRWDAIAFYLPGAIVAFFYLRWHYNKMWSAENEDLQQAFE